MSKDNRNPPTPEPLPSPARLPISTDSSRATVEVVQSTRRMKFLTIHRNEIDNISSLNAHVTAFFSASSFFISLTLSIVIDVLISGTKNLDESGKIVLCAGGIITLILAIVCAIMAMLNIYTRNNIIRTIEDESNEIK